MQAYFLIYTSISIPYLMWSIRTRRLLQINVSNFFFLAHFLVFVLTPLVFEQDYIIKNDVFQTIGLISLVAIFISVPFKFNFLRNIYFEPRLNILKYVFYAYLSVLVVTQIIPGFLNINQDRIMISLEAEYSGRSIWDIVAQLCQILILIYFAYLFKRHRRIFFIFYSLYCLALILNSPHRTPVAIALISPFLIMILNKRKGIVKIRTLVAGAILMASLMFFMNHFRQGLIKDFTIARSSFLTDAFKNTLRGMNTSENLYTLIKNEQEIEYFKNLHYYFVGFIPRRLYSDKPIVSFNIRMTEENFNYKIGSFKGADVLTYTVPGEGYIQFGYLGVLLLSVLAIVFSRQLIIFYLKYNYIDFVLIIFLFKIFLNYRSAFDSFFYSTVYSTLFLLLLLPFFKIKKGNLRKALRVVVN